MRRVAPLLLLPLLLVACGHHSSVHRQTAPPPPPTTTSSSTTAPEPTVPTTVALTVYFLHDGKLAPAVRTVPSTQAVGTAALTSLAQGPTPAERADGLRSDVPRSYKPGLTVLNGLATLEPMQFSEASVAQLVYTLTQFPTVQAVRIGVDGRHLTRASLERYLPPIFVESPAAGQFVTSPLQLSGTANTFEGSFDVELRAGGRLLVKQTVKAASGSGTRGRFAASIPFHIARPASGIVLAYTRSPANGRPVDVVRIPVLVKP